MTPPKDRPPLHGEGLGVAVLGATGAVGRDLLAVLPKAGLPLGLVRAFARASSAGTTVELGDRALPVLALPDDPAVGGAFDGIDLAFGALPPELGRSYGVALAAMGVTYIDIGGALADRAPMLVPALEIGLDALARVGEVRIASSPSAPALALAHLLHALQPLRPHRCIATIQLSASAAGAAGVDELSRQVVAAFNQSPPPRKVFPGGLAFDLLGQVGVAEDGWTGPERRVGIEVATLVGLPVDRLSVTLVVAPVFAGLAVSAWIAVEELPDRADVEALLQQTQGLRVGDPVPGVRRAVGQSGLFVGRVRLDPVGDALSLWAVADNTRFGATANAVQIARLLHHQGVL